MKMSMGVVYEKFKPTSLVTCSITEAGNSSIGMVRWKQEEVPL
jgi:hypothetical protein